MNKQRDFKSEVELLKAAYPDLEQIPDQAAQAAAQGKPMVEAYQAWMAQQEHQDKAAQQIAAENAALKAENESLKRQIAVLKQNASAQERALGGGVQGGGTEKPAGNGFLAGLNSGGW